MFIFHDNIVTNVSKEQLESSGEELAESWRHQQPAAPSYAPPISSATDPYSAAGKKNVFISLLILFFSSFVHSFLSIQFKVITEQQEIFRIKRSEYRKEHGQRTEQIR